MDELIQIQEIKKEMELLQKNEIERKKKYNDIINRIQAQEASRMRDLEPLS